MEAATGGSARAGETGQKLLHVATLKFEAAPFRADRFALAYLPLVPRVLDYGAKGYSFYRSDQNSRVFTHISYWEDKKDFEQFWFSQELQELRREIPGGYVLPLFPDWHTVLEHGGEIG